MKHFFSSFAKTEKFYIIILAAVSIAVILPVLFKGLPYGHDLPHHYQCAMTFVESIQNGDFYPSWSLNRNFGFGGMESRLYPPLSHYVLALFYLAFGDWHIASWLVFILFTFLGSFGVYLWAKETLPASQAVFAGCIYALLPYHLNQLYNTFFYAEFAGSAVLPFVFVYVSRVCRRGKTIDILGLAIAYATLILTHLPLTVIGSICFGVYALTLLKREDLVKQIVKLSIGALIAAGASSFFWIKVLLERDLMAKATIYSDFWLDYRINFLLTAIQTYDGFSIQVYENGTYFYDLMLFYALLVVIACTIPFFIWKKRFETKEKGVWLIFGIALFLTLPFSRFVWDKISILQELQFPWRWLAIICVTASVLAATKLHYLHEWFGNKKRPFALIITGCVLAMMSFSISQIIRQAPFIETKSIESSMETNQKDIGLEFWWTIWTRKEFVENKEKVSAENRNIQIEKWSATEKIFDISAGNSDQARVAVFYHPNWKAFVNNSPAAVKSDADGAVLIPLTAENSRIQLIFQEPPAVRVSQWISGFIWLLLIVLLVFQIKFAANNLPLSTKI